MNVLVREFDFLLLLFIHYFLCLFDIELIGKFMTFFLVEQNDYSSLVVWSGDYNPFRKDGLLRDRSISIPSVHCNFNS